MTTGVKQSHQAFSQMFKQMALAFVGGGLATFLAFFLAATLIVSRELSLGVFYYFAMVGVCFGCFVCAAALAFLHKESWFLCGFWAFLLFVGVLGIFAWCDGTRSISTGAFICAVFLFLSGCGGGYFGVHKAVKRAKHRHK